MSSHESNQLPSNVVNYPRLALAINADERFTFLESHLGRLKATAEVVDIVAPEGAFIEAIGQQEPEILVTGWSTPWLGPLLNSPNCRLKYVCHLTGSVRQVVPREFLENGGAVTNWGLLANSAVAEHALLLALAALRNMPAWGHVIGGSRNISATRALRTQCLSGRRIGIHGFGGVAQALVRLLKPFACPISSYSAAAPADLIKSHGVDPAPSLAHLFAQSEVLFECEALTPTTRHSVSARELALLRDQAVFINVARGDLVDEAALIREASSGRIRIALDVITDEPLTLKSAVSGIVGAVLSPHIAGPTLDQYPEIGELAVTNIERYVAGIALQGLVTIEVFDRST